MWRYDIAQNRWSKIKQRGDVPSPRCGHTLSAFGERLWLFGGLKEVTQESNGMFRFNPETNTWDEIGKSGTADKQRFMNTCSVLEKHMDKVNSTQSSVLTGI